MLGAGTARAGDRLTMFIMVGLHVVKGARAIRAALAACLLLAVATPASAVPQASFRPLGDLPGGAFASQGWGVSADGSTVVGFGTTDQDQEAFRWNVSDGLQSLGALCTAGSQGCKSTARSVSADGMVVVGRSTSDAGVEAFRWTPSAGMVGLGDLDHPCNGTPPCFDSGAWSVSADGSVVVGRATSFVNGQTVNEAFRWTKSSGMVGLGDLDDGADEFFSQAFSVSADGSTAGGLGTGASGREAVLWTAGGMMRLGDLPGDGFFSEVFGLSKNGLIAAGGGRSAACSNQGCPEAFRWTPSGGLVGLGDLPGDPFFSKSVAISADGSVIVGTANFDNATEVGDAFIWDAVHGMRRLQDVLAGLGVDLGGFTRLTIARDISADGLTIVGTGTNAAGDSEAWVATLPLTELPRVLIPLTGKRLLIKNKVPDDKEKNKGVWVAWDAMVMAGARRTANDPRCNADPPGTVKASIRFFSLSSGQDTGPLPLPCENWSALGLDEKPRGYRYKDPELDQGPCRLVLIRDGKRMKAVCQGNGAATDFLYDLSEGSDQGSVNVVLSTGVRDHCTAFPAFNGKTGTDGKRFLGKNASPPSTCAIPPAP